MRKSVCRVLDQVPQKPSFAAIDDFGFMKNRDCIYSAENKGSDHAEQLICAFVFAYMAKTGFFNLHDEPQSSLQQMQGLI